MDTPKLSLKWLEVFQAVARGGSLQEAARRLSLSISTVSHHLTCLEAAVGVALVEHRRRPMRLTPEGTALLTRVDEALGALETGIAELWARDPATLIRALKIAVIEDLDALVTPRLAARLVTNLPGCALSFLSRPSHDILLLLQREEVDLGIAARAEWQETPLAQTPLLRDPYLLVTPKAQPQPPEAYLSGAAGLPFLRYSKTQVMGRRIDAQLQRMRVTAPSSLEFESTTPVLAMVANGQAWTISTALNVAAHAPLAQDLRLLTLPGAGFARQLSVYGAARVPEPVFTLVATTLRPLVEAQLIAPLVCREPWLRDIFHLTQP